MRVYYVISAATKEIVFGGSLAECVNWQCNRINPELYLVVSVNPDY